MEIKHVGTQAIASGIVTHFFWKVLLQGWKNYLSYGNKILAAMDETLLQASRFASSSSEAHLM
jgi:hypothetical protein